MRLGKTFWKQNSNYKIKVPEEGSGLSVVASISGGKDSTALALALIESNIPTTFVFADTGWESTQTYEYLDILRDRLKIKIHKVANQTGGFVDKCYDRCIFPGMTQRWCSRELKIHPLNEFHQRIIENTGEETISALGIRAEESRFRSTLPVWGDDRVWGGIVWRPIIDWSTEKTIEIHKRHGIPVNPLYQLGFSRVGCWPCIFAEKASIILLSKVDPKRIDYIESIEKRISDMRRKRNIETPGRYKNEHASFFSPKGSRKNPITGIRNIIRWYETHGDDKEYIGGCLKWGFCE